MIQHHVQPDPPFLHAGLDVFNGTLDHVLTQRFLVAIPLKGDPNTPAIGVFLAFVATNPRMPHTIGVIPEDCAPSVSGNQAMVGDLTLGTLDPAYPACVASPAVMEDDG